MFFVRLLEVFFTVLGDTGVEDGLRYGEACMSEACLDTLVDSVLWLGCSEGVMRGENLETSVADEGARIASWRSETKERGRGARKLCIPVN